MGNRGMVFFNSEESKGLGVYLHWNGGPESIEGFIQALNDRGWTRMDYSVAKLCAVVSEYFDANGDDFGLSLGVFQADPNTAYDQFGLNNHPCVVSHDDKGKFYLEQRGKRVKLNKNDQEKANAIREELKALRSKRSVTKGVN